MTRLANVRRVRHPGLLSCHFPGTGLAAWDNVVLKLPAMFERLSMKLVQVGTLRRHTIPTFAFFAAVASVLGDGGAPAATFLREEDVLGLMLALALPHACISVSDVAEISGERGALADIECVLSNLQATQHKGQVRCSGTCLQLSWVYRIYKLFDTHLIDVELEL